MIEQQGVVLAAGDGLARIRLGGTSGCPACDSGEGCGAGLFGRLLNRRPLELDLDDPIPTRVGQPVRVGIRNTLLLRLVWRFYGAPLLAFMLGAAVATSLWSERDLLAELGVLVIALGAMFIVGAWARRGLPELQRNDVVLLGQADGASRCRVDSSVGRNAAGDGVTKPR